MDTARQVQTTGTPIETTYGTFTASSKPSQWGVSMNLTFRPHPEAKAAKQPVGLIQTTRLTRTQMSLKDQYEDEPLKLKRMTELGTHIDQSTYVDTKGQVLTETEAKELWSKEQVCIPQTNPVYNATNSQHKTARSLLEYTELSPSFGRIYDPGDQGQPARLIDNPSRLVLQDETIEHVFETVALTLAEPYRYLGSVTWGYKIVAGKQVTQAKLTPYSLTKLSDSIPTEEFLTAAALWNEQKIVDYSLNEKISRVQIPLLLKVEVKVENLVKEFDEDIITMILQGTKGEYRTKDGKPWLLVKLSQGICTFLTYEK